jgi:hypothetical protein
MNVYSAAEAIGPAWERTRSILLEPFEGRRYLKLTFVAMLAALSTSGFSLPNPARIGLAINQRHPLPPGVAAVLVGLAILFAVGIFVIGLVLFYIGSRFQFVVFEVVATEGSAIGPMWRKYGRQTWRWIWLKVLLFVGAGLVGIVLALMAFMPLFRQIARSRTAGALPPGAVLHHLFGPLLLVMFFVLVVAVIYLLLWDFALPPMALEDAGMGTAIGRVAELIRNEPGEMFLYLLVRFLLGIVFGMAAMLVYGIAMLISLLPFGIVGGALYLALRNAGMAGHLLLISAAIVGALLVLVWNVCLYAAAVGYVIYFWQAYALVFYGGRYPLLGNLLEPPPPAPAVAPEPPSPPDLPPLPEAGLS